jgi:hypothetical protein
MKKIRMKRDFTWNGKLLKKGEILEIHTKWKRKDIDLTWAKALILKGVAEEISKKSEAIDSKTLEVDSIESDNSGSSEE